jgi:hypothetical protein
MFFQNYFLNTLAFSIFILLAILIRRFSTQTNTILFVFKHTALTLLFSFAWFVVAGKMPAIPNNAIFFDLIACALLMALGLWCFVEANKHVTLSSILSVQVFGLITKIYLSENQLNHHTGLVIYLSLLFCILGLLLQVSLPENRIGFFWAIFSTMGWCLGYEYMFTSLRAIGTPLTFLIVESSLFVLSVLFLIHRNQIRQFANLLAIIDPSTLIIALLSTLFVLVLSYGANFFEIAAFSMINLFIYPISILLVRAIFNDLLVTKEWIGNALILVGLVCLYIFFH